MVASEPKYADHLAPIAAALGAPIVTPSESRTSELALVASYRDLAAARGAGYRRFARMEHGIGQSYAGEPKLANAPEYPGGADAADVELFLVPNVHSAERWSTAYPRATVEIVGSPRLETLPWHKPLMPPATPTVAVSFHWDYHGCPETRSALEEYREVIVHLARRQHVIGHGHPWLMKRGLDEWYANRGIEVVADFAEVVRRADLYVCDNSSTLYEAAAAGLGVVTLNSWWYRRDVRHGLRFWDAIPGLVCDRPKALPYVVVAALEDPSEAREARVAALEFVYARRAGATDAAIAALSSWAAG